MKHISIYSLCRVKIMLQMKTKEIKYKLTQNGLHPLNLGFVTKTFVYKQSFV